MKNLKTFDELNEGKQEPKGLYRNNSEENDKIAIYIKNGIDKFLNVNIESIEYDFLEMADLPDELQIRFTLGDSDYFALEWLNDLNKYVSKMNIELGDIGNNEDAQFELYFWTIK